MPRSRHEDLLVRHEALLLRLERAIDRQEALVRVGATISSTASTPSPSSARRKYAGLFPAHDGTASLSALALPASGGGDVAGHDHLSSGASKESPTSARRRLSPEHLLSPARSGRTPSVTWADESPNDGKEKVADEEQDSPQPQPAALTELAPEELCRGTVCEDSKVLPSTAADQGQSTGWFNGVMRQLRRKKSVLSTVTDDGVQAGMPDARSSSRTGGDASVISLTGPVLPGGSDDYSYSLHQQQLVLAARDRELALRESLYRSTRDQEIHEPENHTAFTSSRGWLSSRREDFRWLVKHNYFEILFSLLIFGNVVLFGVEVQYAAMMLTNESNHVLYWLARAFDLVFVLELACRICAQGCEFFLSPEDRFWNGIDSCLVLISLLQLTVEQFKLRYMRMLRVAKAVRLFRLLRLMKVFRSLRLLIYSIANTLRALGWTIVLLFVILYLFGVVFTQAATQYIIGAGSDKASSDTSDLYQYWGTLEKSIYTLFLSISGGINWADAMNSLDAVSPLWVYFFIVYIFFTYFAVLNVVTGVFCQMAIESASQDATAIMQAQQAAQAEYVKMLSELFALIDSQHLGKITVGAFEESMDDEKVQAFFASIDLSVSDAWELFKLLDHDETHVIDIEDFVHGCLQLRGHARSVDIALMRYEVKWMMEGFRRYMTTTSRQLQLMVAMLKNTHDAASSVQILLARGALCFSEGDMLNSTSCSGDPAAHPRSGNIDSPSVDAEEIEDDTRLHL